MNCIITIFCVNPFPVPLLLPGLYGPLLSLSLANIIPDGCSNLTAAYDSETAQIMSASATLSALEDSSNSLEAALGRLQVTHAKVSHCKAVTLD